MNGDGTAPDPTPLIIRNIRALRQRRGWSAERLAKELGSVGCAMGRSMIANMESGRRPRLTVDELYAFAHVLGVSADCLSGHYANARPVTPEGWKPIATVRVPRGTSATPACFIAEVY